MRSGRKTPEAITRGTDFVRDLILAKAPGSHLGSEASLMRLLGVSRPTFLQVARILQREQLLEVRRGRSGGYYTRTPDIETVVTSAATYLIARKTTLNQLLHALKHLHNEIMRLALECEDEALRDELRVTLIERRLGPAQPASLQDLMADEVRFLSAVARMTESPPLEIASATLHHMSLLQSRFQMQDASPAYLKAWHESGLELAQAILDRDRERVFAIHEARYHMAENLAEVDSHSPSNIKRDPTSQSDGTATHRRA